MTFSDKCRWNTSDATRLAKSILDDVAAMRRTIGVRDMNTIGCVADLAGKIKECIGAFVDVEDLRGMDDDANEGWPGRVLRASAKAELHLIQLADEVSTLLNEAVWGWPNAEHVLSSMTVEAERLIDGLGAVRAAQGEE